MTLRDYFEVTLLILGILFLPLISSILFLHQIIRQNSLIEIVFQVLEACIKIVTAIPHTILKMWNLKSSDTIVAGVIKLGMFLLAFPFVFAFLLLNDELL